MNSFTFQSPVILWCLALALPLGLLLVYARRKRIQVIAAMGGGWPTHRRLRDTLRLVAFCLMVLALARPGHSPHSETSTRSGRDVVFALDVSRSMLAKDVLPSRLEVAKQGIRDALDSFANERVGLVLYAGSASILCPLTYDYGFIRYMLEQAHPRSVDFGGTTLQAAVEKSVDQVFMEGRGSVQDLIVLTDGGDHGSQIPRVLELLNSHKVDALLIGLGDPDQASSIPIEDGEGHVTKLAADGKVVYTRLDDASLRALAAESGRIDYVAAGTQAFHLGRIYDEYAADKPIESLEESSSQLTYEESAAYFLIPAVLLLLLSECWGARGLQWGFALLSALLMGANSDLSAADSVFRERYQAATQSMQAGAYAEAEAAFGELYAEAPRSLAPKAMAALQFNRGLCLLKISEALAATDPVAARNEALDARDTFLNAKRYAPELDRAGLRLDTTSEWLTALAIRIGQQEQTEKALKEAMEALVNRLQALLEAQLELRRTSREETDTETQNAKADALSRRQGGLLNECRAIKAQMLELDGQMSAPLPPDLSADLPSDSLLSEPLALMAEVEAAQERAQKSFANHLSWPAARAHGQTAENKLQEILDLLAGQADASSDGESEPDDYDDYDYNEDAEGDQESMTSSEAMQGDFAAGTTMQELPAPNYSTEDILLEEQSNLQFRQQQRASANATKVEKDY